MAILAEMTVDGWRPGPGDPNFTGWLTVLAYLIAGVLCFLTSRREKQFRQLLGPQAAPSFWFCMGAVLILLAINKQLDLQSAITWIGRSMAKKQGWYHVHRQVQAVFIAGVATVAIAVAGGCLWWVYGRGRSLMLALVGIIILLAFITIRAASFHHVDVFLGHQVAGTRVNVVLELGGICIVAVAAAHGLWCRRRTVRPVAHAERTH